MQFLIYVTLLMVSVSTVLLEVHWLTTPPPQPRPVVQPANTPAPVRQVEGPSPALSPIYPKKTETTGSAANTQPPARQSRTDESIQKPQAETTGTAHAEDVKRRTVEAAGLTPAPADSRQASADPSEAAASSDYCDVRACASAYRSFRASDCTYQPFEGARRICEKPSIQRTTQQQTEEQERRKWSRDAESHALNRAAQKWYDEDDEDEDNLGSDDAPHRPLMIHRQTPRW